MPAGAMPPAVQVAIARASDTAGLSQQLLLGEARRESRFDPAARAPTSSAAGLFQFIDQTWLAAVKRYGAAHGYARYAALVRECPDGRFAPAGPGARAALDALRLDPRAASLLAADMALDQARWLKTRLGRPPTPGEVYAAHFLGAEGAAKLILAARSEPQAEAQALFPEAAKANPTLFFADGRGVSVERLYAELTGARARPAPRDSAFAAYAAARNAEHAAAHQALIRRTLVANLVPAPPLVSAKVEIRPAA
ncbi:MAG TPA: transglycosylase SLT domain-containing protein [Caulobacteraceae bacterium]|nr:transglycosylase SLT domain-containing protein [Caulobacteraceae bacterium]